ncbi:ABC transporter ATP-binding protein [Desulfuribacillus alkaliarsenatis]|uniref:Peptide ABC transporter n=1 Tax=Desulfuribacillus alkaliarsenatis TaxID=766136 RepID=A0A1E5G1Z1_9FIRM|nr:ATP-binding cassette domain-containing protein [Desulfuribacillus alkaliarsenatis]OEF96999.1 peptide ABC transporter [Desulfuribacillus alkaliarsenatis]
MQLKAEKVGYYYKDNEWLFRDFQITVDPGEIIAIQGKSGKGKTTLAQILAGYQKPMEGSVLLGEQELISSKNRISYTGFYPVQLVWQHPEKAVNPRWKLRETLYEAGELDEIIIEQLGIEKQWLERWPNELSGGELQRICVARALHKDTKYLIADEMTSMLDALTQSQIWNVVLDVARDRNIGIIVISHDKHLINKLCNRIVQL